MWWNQFKITFVQNIHLALQLLLHRVVGTLFICRKQQDKWGMGQIVPHQDQKGKPIINQLFPSTNSEMPLDDLCNSGVLYPWVPYEILVVIFAGPPLCRWCKLRWSSARGWLLGEDTHGRWPFNVTHTQEGSAQSMDNHLQHLWCNWGR